MKLLYKLKENRNGISPGMSLSRLRRVAQHFYTIKIQFTIHMIFIKKYFAHPLPSEKFKDLSQTSSFQNNKYLPYCSGIPIST